MMDIALLILAIALLISGFIGAMLPIVPGPPLSWLGLLTLHLSEYGHFSTGFLIISAVVMVIITALDYLVPVWGTKKMGGSRAGVAGSAIGLLIGLFFLPLGIIIGPFVGAFLGELIHRPRERRKALRSATGSFLGFLLGLGLKLAYGAWAMGACILMAIQ